jgi:hypothetical protein
MIRAWPKLLLLAASLAFGTSSCSDDEGAVEVEGQATTGGVGGGPPDLGRGGTPPVTLPEGGEPSVSSGGEPSSMPLCGGLVCGALEECRQTPSGDFECVRVACDSDVDCPEAKYCNGRVCVDDECQAGQQRCDGDDVFVCVPNGSSEEQRYSCTGSEFFESQCGTTASGLNGCSCEDDWDCPQFTECDGGACIGSGEAPTCTLPPADFSAVLPSLEFHWGGVDAMNPQNALAPFAESAQVVSTPVVANLNDDNGDGLIDERDFPEILFMSYRGDTPGNLGIVRAVHGGGAAKGKDYFALCGDPDAGGAHWFEGDAISLTCGTNLSSALSRPSGGLAVADLDGDGAPEIVVPTAEGGIQILDNEGRIRVRSASALWPAHTNLRDQWASPAPAIANLDFSGLPEIVVGNRVIVLGQNAAGALEISRVFTGAAKFGAQDATNGDNFQSYYGPMVCVADVASADGLEIIAGSSAYTLPEPVDCTSNPSSDFCEGRLTLLWDAQAVNGVSSSSGIPLAQSEGFCAVADVLGKDRALAPGPSNPLDGSPEVVLIANGYLILLDGETGSRLRYQQVDQLVSNEPTAGTRGGAPNIDDFDGDGFPEIATALSHYYAVIDLQEPSDACPAWPSILTAAGSSPGANPARTPADAASNADGTCMTDAECSAGAVCSPISRTCVCLHNGWARRTEDDSSRATSSSVFDFNGDGAAEVVYNDQCYFRVYGGATGSVFFAEPSLSRTVIENPVVADVDNDGNAEIIVVSNNETRQCTYTQLDARAGGKVPQQNLPNGIDVWGDANDTWVSARRIWNQHSYHVTNVTEDGRVPVHEPPNFREIAPSRYYNTYRSQPRSYGIAPDLAVLGIQISSPGAECGTLTDEVVISIEIRNQGDLRVGPGIQVEFSGNWGGGNELLTDSQGEPLRFTIDKSLDPNASVLISVPYDASNSAAGKLPDTVTATVDPTSDASDHGLERECDETNNSISKDVNAIEGIADVWLEIDGAEGCAAPTVAVTVHNDGSAPAVDVVVRIYAGDPSQGGRAVGEVTIAGPIPPQGSAEGTVELERIGRNITLHAVVDPLDAVLECNDANNRTVGPLLECAPITE